MTKEREALRMALDALENTASRRASEQFVIEQHAVAFIKQVLEQPEQEPVAMKFKIYKPTVPDPTRQDINNALLPWVYDQDRSSGFDASMWVTPVATLPPQRKPLTDEEREKLRDAFAKSLTSVYVCGRVWDAWQYSTMSEDDFQPASECEELLDELIEAAHSIKGDA